MDNGASSYRRFLDGDESGFAEIVEMYGYNLIFFINGFVGNISVAEDLMEDAFCELVYHKRRFKGNSTFKTYLFSIARHKAVDYINKKSRIPSLPLENAELHFEELNQLESKVIEDENKMLINKALAKINSDYRAILHLLYFEDSTYEQAALILNKNNKQIKNLAYRAKQALRVAIEKEGFIYEE